MYTGVVEWFDPVKGCGRIQVDGHEGSAFVHRKYVVDDRYRNLVSNEPVQFAELIPTEKGLEARRVQSRLADSGRCRGFVESFDHDKGYGYVRSEDEDTKYFIHWREIIGKKRHEQSLWEDEPVEFAVKKRSKPGQYDSAVELKRLDCAPALYKFGVMGREQDWLKALADMAAPEEGGWRYRTIPNGSCSHPLLKKYLTHTFKHLRDQSERGDHTIAYGKSDRGLRCGSFNTGLETEYHEPIYGYFEAKHYRKDAPLYFVEFVAESDDRMHGRFEDGPPEPAKYYDDPSVLVFHPEWPLSLAAHHIAHERIERFPAHVRGDTHAAASMLRNVVEQARERVRRNYKVAVPQFYHGRVELMLPICLNSRTQADLALTLRCRNKQYKGTTVLLLDQAYNSARLITRPDTDWLHP